jgi:hypothetical protein
MTRPLQGYVIGMGRGAALVLGLVVLGAALTRGDGQEDLSPQKVHLELRLLATSARFGTMPSGSMSGDLAVGESQVWSLTVGLDPDPRGAAACRTQVHIPAPEVLQRDVPDWAAHLWEARLTVRTASLEKIELEVAWRRLVRGQDGKPHEAAGDSRAVTLGEGQRRLLDFVAVPKVPAWESCYSNLALELEARIAEDPALADHRIGYDLWLVDEGPRGPSTNRRWQVTGKQGKAEEFDFETVRRSIPVSGIGGETSARVETHVSGQVRARVTSDGALEVAIVAHRSDSLEQGHWSIGGFGSKRVRVAPGESMRLELPSPAEAPRTPAEPATETEANQRILAGLRERSVSLVLTARPVE